MSKFVVDKDIPIPERMGSDRRRKYPWPDMEVGDSVFIESSELRERKAISGSAYGYARDSKKKFTIRAVDGGFRVWRWQ